MVHQASSLRRAQTVRSLHLLQLAASLLFALALAGCGGSDEGDDSDPPDDSLCGMDVDVSGAVTRTAEFTGCSQFALESGQLSVNFIDVDVDWSAALDIGPVTPDTTATGVPAVVGVILDMDAGGGERQRWDTAAGACTVDLTTFEAAEDDFFGPGHRVAGEGRCSGPALGTGFDPPMGEVTIAPFQFHFFADDP